MLLGRRYKRAKKGHGKRGPEKTDRNEQSFGTAEKLAAEHGVDEKTVRRAGGEPGEPSVAHHMYNSPQGVCMWWSRHMYGGCVEAYMWWA